MYTWSDPYNFTVALVIVDTRGPLSGADRVLISTLASLMPSLHTGICLALLALVSLGYARAAANDAPHVFTISAFNNAAFVITFAQTFRTYDNTTDLSVFWSDHLSSNVSKALEPVFEQLEELNVRSVLFEEFELLTPYNLQLMALRSSLPTFATNMRPPVFQYLFNVEKVQRAIYFDNDMWVNQRLDEVYALLEEYAVLVVPHILSPYKPNLSKPSHFNIWQSGVFNHGFIGLSNKPSSHIYLEAWGEELQALSLHDLDSGMSEQRFGSLLFGFIDQEEIKVLRDARYDVAYWNLHERGDAIHMRESDEQRRLPVLMLNDTHPLAFFHFSGFPLDPDHKSLSLAQMSRHQDRWSLFSFPRLMPVFEEYRAMLLANNALEYRELPYAFDYFRRNATLVLPMIPKLKNHLREYTQPKESQLDICDLLFHLTVDLSQCIFEMDCIPVQKTTGRYKMALPDWLFQEFCGRIAVTSLDMPKLPSLAFGSRIAPAELLPPTDQNQLNIFQYVHSLQHMSPGRILWEKEMDASLLRRDFDCFKQSMDPLVLGVNLFGHLQSHFGIGNSGNHARVLLDAVGIPHADNLLPNGCHKTAVELPDTLSNEAPYPVSLIVTNDDQTLWAMRRFYDGEWGKRYNIGYWFWELDRLPDAHYKAMDYMDELWVASEWQKQATINNPLYNGIPVTVIPIYANYHEHLDLANIDRSSSEQNTGILEELQVGKDTTVFFTLFDFLSCVYRKNPMAAIKAFGDAFDDSDDVVLVVKMLNDKVHPGCTVDGSYITEAHNLVMDALASTGVMRNRIRMISRVLSKEDMDILQSRADCFVSLHRSEGLGLGPFVSLLHSRPTILTGYSATMEYFEPFRDILGDMVVDYDMVSVEKSRVYFDEDYDNHWAEPKHHEAVAVMQNVYRNYDEYRTRAITAGKGLRKMYSEEEQADTMRIRLKEIEQKLYHRFDDGVHHPERMQESLIEIERSLKRLEARGNSLESIQRGLDEIRSVFEENKWVKQRTAVKQVEKVNQEKHARAQLAARRRAKIKAKDVGSKQGQQAQVLSLSKWQIE